MVKTKILYVADTAPPKKDGVVRFMMETYIRLNPEKYDISFLIPKIEGAENIARKMNINATFVPVRRFKIANYPTPIPKSKIIREVIDNTDIIFINSIGPLGSASLKYAKKIGKKIIEYVHSIDWELFAYATRFPDRYASKLAPIVKRQYSKSDLLIVANKTIKTILRGHNIENKIKIVPLGVDLKKFKPDLIMRSIMRKKLGLENKFVIGYHGRLSTEKNIKLLVDSFQNIKKRIPKSKLLIIGDGDEKKWFSKQNKIIEDIVNIGFVDNPEKYLLAVDVYILPSQTETTGLSLMEAMAIGLPCIATNVGAIPSYLKNNVNGLLLKKDKLDVNLLSFAIEKLYREPLLRTKLKQNARRIISSTYTWEKTTIELEAIFDSMLNK
jgi:glycosyltransferase involved in cell wall biosynthesis